MNLDSGRSASSSNEEDDEDEDGLVLRDERDGDAAHAEDEEEGDGHPAAAKTVDREEEKDSGNAANWFELVRSFVGPSNQ